MAAKRGLTGATYRSPEAVRTDADMLVVAPIAATIIASGIFANGYDSALGQATSCLFNGLLLVFMVMTVRPSGVIWRTMARPVFCVLAALAWLLAVAFVRFVLLPGQSSLPTASDLFLPKFLSIVSGLWALMSGFLIGWRPLLRKRAIQWLLLLIVTHMLLGLMLSLIASGGIWDNWTVMRQGRFSGLLGNVNVTASICGLGAIFGLSGVVASGKGNPGEAPWEYRPLAGLSYAIALLLLMMGLMLTASRFPAFLAFLSLAILGAWQWAGVKSSRLRLMPPIVIAALLFLLAQLIFSDLLVERVGNLGQEGYARSQFWSHFLDIGMSAPWTGYGPGAFPSANAYFLEASSGTPATWSINSPHSIVLQLLIVGGFPYLILMVSAAVLVLRDIFRRFDWRRYDVDQAALLIAIFFIPLCGMVDIAMDIPASASVALFVVGMGWADVLSRRIASAAL